MTLIASIDGPNRRVYLHADTVGADVHPIDIYKEMRTLRETDESLRKYLLFMRASGNVSKGSGKFTERLVTLLLGTRVIPFDTDHEITVTGTFITDDGQEGTACFDRTSLSAGTAVDISYVPPQVEVVRAEDELAALRVLSFNEKVSMDENSSNTGTIYPAGNFATPLNNLADAKIVSTAQNTKVLDFRSNWTFGNTDVLTNLQLQGRNSTQTTFTFTAGCTTIDTTIINATITGVMNGAALFQYNKLKDLTGFGCTSAETLIDSCGLQGTLVVNSVATEDITFKNCFTAAGVLPHVVVDYNSVACNITFHGYQGGLTFKNLDQAKTIAFDFTGGHLLIDTTCTAGTIYLSGEMSLTDNSGAGCTVIDERRAEGGAASITQQDKDDIIAGVWAAAVRTLTSGGGGGSLTAEQSTQLKELWQIEGLDPTNPMTATKTTRVVASIIQIFTGDRKTSTTATRQ